MEEEDDGQIEWSFISAPNLVNNWVIFTLFLGGWVSYLKLNEVIDSILDLIKLFLFNHNIDFGFGELICPFFELLQFVVVLYIIPFAKVNNHVLQSILTL